VTVPAGTFEAIRVEWWITLPASHDPILVRTEWYSQRVGLVKRTEALLDERTVQKDSTPAKERVLKSFTPGKN
jgi:hypothetical protein